ncbi:MAG: nucleotidyltransferase domain-containing protein [Anaerolineales bacterium]
MVGLLGLLDGAGIEFWLDGGWGVDALLKEQTRPHKDVDLVLRLEDVPKVRQILGARGFAVQDGSPPHSFVLGDGRGHEVDVHAAAFDGQGNGVYRMQNGEDWIYPAQGFTGRGVIAGRPVRCLSPAVQVSARRAGTPRRTRTSEMCGCSTNLSASSCPPN